MKSSRNTFTLFHICRYFLAVLSLSVFSGGIELTAQVQTQTPNIVFLISDDQSAADVGCYGNAAVHTPNLDKLAQEGMRFTRAYVASPQCSPSRAAILTGCSPHVTGAARLHANAFPEFTSVVQLLKDKGYYTGAYRKVHQQLIEKQFDFKGDKDLNAFFGQLPKGKPFFLWFGSTDPHRPYKAGAFNPPHDPAKVKVPDYLPDTPETRQDLAYYYDGIARFDQDCGQLLALLEKHNLSENTIIVVSSDNGMPFPRAKATLYEAGAKVPLIIRWPGKVKAGQVSNALVSLLDLTPTWLEAANVQVPKRMEGRSLLPLLTGGTYQPQEFVFTERNWHDNWDPMRAVIGQRYKLIQNYRPELPYIMPLDRVQSTAWQSIVDLHQQGKLNEKLQWYFKPSRPVVEFYDLQNDPGEWNNLADDPALQPLIGQYQAALSQWMQKTSDFLPPPQGAFPGNSPLNAQFEPLNTGERKPK